MEQIAATVAKCNLHNFIDFLHKIVSYSMANNVFRGDVKTKLCVALLCGVTAVIQWAFILQVIGEIT